MDKQTTLGFILIGLVLIVWMWVQTPSPQHVPPTVLDSTSVAAKPTQEPRHREVQPTGSATVFAHDSLGKYFTPLSSGEEKVMVIKTDLYAAEISTKGGLIRKWTLTNYKTWDQHQAQLVDFDKGGDFSLLFTSSDGKLINTRRLFFRGDFGNWSKVEIHGDETYVLSLSLPLGEGKSIEKRFVFENGKYSFTVGVVFKNVQDIVSNFEYQVVWENGLRYAERNSVDESQSAMGYAHSGGELIEVDAKSENEPVERDINGTTDWVATRNRYFGLAILSIDGKGQGAFVKGVHLAQPDKGAKEIYSLALKLPLGSAIDSSRFTVFIGPLDFGIIKSYGHNLDQIMSLGAAWIIRPIAEYVMIPLFQFLHLFIPNYGFVIIVFSIIIKLALHPLSKTSMKSMKKMQALQPMMAEIREKYKDDPQKMNQQVMTLYKDYGINPAAGCLPMLLQMPILFALYSVFRSSIELRQAAFLGWIHDLSIPDVIFKLPFSLPIFGISEVSGLALAMGITMFAQQKMTVTDPRQKAMVWMMPVMMTLLFNGFPSGLNLYYFVFNVLSIGQQMWLNKQAETEPLKKIERKAGKGGLMARLAKDLPKLKK
jgi:YidC/Oxa1 family membrane protein insertase